MSRATRGPRRGSGAWARCAERLGRIFTCGSLLLSAAIPAIAQENEECLSCHEVEGLSMQRDGREVSLYVDPDRFAASVHGGMQCVDCHYDLEEVEQYPHPRDLPRVDCTECHDDDDGPVSVYRNSTHGREAEEGNPLAPLCQDCHGSHYVLPLEDPDSSISPFNVPRMCAQCHAEGAPVERAYDLPEERVFERYKDSIHGEGLYRQGLTVTAVCTSCHTGHDVRPHTDPRSTISKERVVETCMQCHGRIEEVHRKVIAGELWEKEGIVPICVECHSPHEARRVFYDTNMSNEDCLRCHREPLTASSDGRSLQVDADEYLGSVHGRNDVSCAQCHTGVTPSLERSCETITEPVDCRICHEAEVADYERGRHGRLHAAGDPNAPDCRECHGTHGILEHALPEGATEELAERIRSSPTYSRNVPRLCARCHADGAPAARRYLGDETEIVQHYSMSIHGKGLIESGLTVTAVCTDCHTAHKELPASDPESTVSEENIASTCGRCHDGIYEKYRESIHSKEGNPDYVQLRGMPELPHCNDCHSSHAVGRTDQPAFMLGVMEQCGKCHAEIAETYFETYHGKATHLGDTTKAKCYDCHGAHDILAVDDPRSPLAPGHIVETCGKCHEGSNPGFAGYLAHGTHKDKERYPALYYTYVAMTALLVSVFVFFGAHVIAWLPRSWKLRKEHSRELAAIPAQEKRFLRFTKYERGLHLTVILSFFGLAITGMMLKFSAEPWAQFLCRLVGGTDAAGIIHRVCALATFGYMAAHLHDVWRRYRRSDKTLREFLLGEDSLTPRWRDVRELGQTLRWFIGKGPMPRYGRWTYWEKFDYFAVFWGVVVIGTTGLVLWFPEAATRVLPGWSINVATIIHSDEALLATGFIFTIHFFNTHFRPEKFPMDPVIFTGQMRVKELRLERPELYERLVAGGELERRLVDPVSPATERLVRIFGLSALTVGFVLVILIISSLLTSH